MPSLDTLPTEIIHEIVKHLDEPPFGLQKRDRRFHERVDSLTLASTSKRMRDIIFVRNWVHEHVMEFSYAKLVKSAQKAGLSVRSQVQSLVLRGSCEGQEFEPTFMDYVGIFPNLSSIHIDLVYPYDRKGSHAGSRLRPIQHRQPDHIGKASSHHFKSISLSVNREAEFHGTTHERFTTNVVPQIKRKLKEIGMDKLDLCHLDFATGRTKDNRRYQEFWSDFEGRIVSACLIPAKEVSLDFRGIRMDGEVDRFLDALASAIKLWPREVEAIKLSLPTDDFVIGSHTRNRFKVDEDGQVSLVDGWIPTEKSMTASFQRILNDRPELKRFHLAISVREGGKEDAFNFDYTKDGYPASNKNRIGIATGNFSADVGSSALASGKAEHPASPECKTTINHAVIRILYQHMLQFEGSEVDSLGYGRQRDFDDFDELDEMLRMSQEAANEEYGYYEGEDKWGPTQPYWAMP